MTHIRSRDHRAAMQPALSSICLWLVLALTTLGITPAHAFHFPWDQGHDTTDPNEPEEPGPCEGVHCDPCKSTGSPVYIPTGHFIWSETDISLPGRPGLSLTRTYNSHDPRVGQFGNGWSSDCELRAVKTSQYLVDAEGNPQRVRQVSLVAANGKRYNYERSSNGTYVSFQGREETVSEQADGGLRLATQGGVVYEFDRQGRLTKRVEPTGQSLAYSYDTSGRISSLADGNGRAINFTYNSNGLTSAAADHTGRTWTYGYDENGNLITITDPLGGVRTFDYEAYTAPGDGQTYYHLTKVTDETGVVVTEITYTGSRVASYTAGANRFTYQHDPANRQVTKTDSQDSRWLYLYNEDQVITHKTDPLGNLVQYQYDADGNLTQYTDALGHAWKASFDSQKRKTQDTSPLGFVAEYSYATDFSFATGVKTPTGRELTRQLNTQGDLVQAVNGEGAAVTMAWDDAGNLSSVSDPLGNVTQMTYNAYGLVQSTRDALGNGATFSLDDLGRIAGITGAEGQKITVTYDALDRPLTVTDPSGGETNYTYDAAGRTLTFTDPAGKTTTYGYDAFGRLTTRTYPDGGVVSLTYRSDNLVSSITHADSSLTNYTYDAAKLVSQVTAGESITSYTYSPRYELLTATNASNTISYTYDADGRLVAEVQGGISLAYSYNDEGERTGLTFNGSDIAYERNKNGWITKITAPEGDYTFTYDAEGKRTGLTRPNGSRESAEFDAAERLVKLTHEGPFAAEYGYSYSADNTLTGISATTGNWSYTYDEDLQLIAAASGDNTFAYPVDAAGNIMINGRIYDDNHRLIESEDANFEYDARGNLTRKTDKSTKAYTLYSWNGEDQLVQVQRFADDVAALPTTDIVYTYDPLGRRLSRTKDGVTERFVYDGNDLIATLTADGTAAATYTFGPGIDSPLSGDFSGARRYFHADHLGSIVALTDDMAVTDTYRYGPFGENLDTMGSTPNPFRYTAREYESDDLYYYRNRYYDPTLQRFLSEDRQGFGGGDHNLYRYVGNNPANFTDPSGNWAFLIPAIWAGVELGMSLYDAYDTYHTVTDPCLGLGDKLTAGGLLAAGTILPGSNYSKIDDLLKVTKRPGSFRRKTLNDSWDNAADGSRPGTKQCPDCQKDVTGDPHRKEKRNGPDGWDNDHQPKWKDRDLDGLDRKQVLDEYNRDTRLRCASCNRSDNQ